MIANEGSEQVVIALKMTTHQARPDYWGEYEIIDYTGAGLKKKTTVRCSKWLRLSKSSFRSKIGILQPIDIMNITNIIRQIR